MEYFIVAVVGLCIGSFLNVCIYRLPREGSILKPRLSFCPKCKKTINWYDNIPLVSFLLLKGKCRSCKEKISLRYFFVELLTGVLFLLTYINFGLSLLSLKIVILLSLCVLVSFIDIEFRAIPASLCIIGIILGLLISFIETFIMFDKGEILTMRMFDLPLVGSFLGLFLCIGISYSFKLLGDFGVWIYLALKNKESVEGEKEALGLGDVDFLGMVGAFLGWKLGFLTFFLAPLAAVLYGIYIIAFKRSHLIAYLPFLSLGCFICIFWGEQLIRWLFPY